VLPSIELPLGPMEILEGDNFAEVNTDFTREQEYAFSWLLNSEEATSKRILADIYTLGLFNVQVDLNRAKELYESITKMDNFEEQAHSHFMLGVFYATGLLGKFERDEAKALVHYQNAADLGNIQAQLTLAHKYMFGVNVIKNVETATYYFQLVNNKLEKLLPKEDGRFIFDLNLDKFSVRWSDFEGGIFGSYATEAFESTRYFETFKDSERILDTLVQIGVDTPEAGYQFGDDPTLDTIRLLYFQTQSHYHGDYFHARAYGKAFEFAELCVRNGLSSNEQFEELDFQLKENPNVFDNGTTGTHLKFDMMNVDINIEVETKSPLNFMVAQCSSYLGHMYLRGEGTTKDYQKAYHYLKLGATLAPVTKYLHDIALMDFYGLGVDQDIQKVKALTERSEDISHNRYFKFLMIYQQLRPGEVLTPDDDRLLLLRTASKYSTLAKRQILQLVENGQLKMDMNLVVGRYNEYLKLFEDMIFDFKIPFFAFLNSDNDKSNNLWISLVSNVIASEIGYETAKSSLGEILYPMIGKYKYRVNRDKDFAEVYTPFRFEESLRYYQSSALHSNTDSMNIVGDLYFNGLPSPVKFDHHESFVSRLYQYVRGILFGKGKEEETLMLFPSNKAKSFGFYHDAAVIGSHQGGFNVGYAYEYGLGVQKDLHLAKRYYDASLIKSDVSYIPVKFALMRVWFKNKMNIITGDSYDAYDEQRTWLQRLKTLLVKT